MNPNQNSKCFECSEKSACFMKLSDNELALTNENKVQIRFKKGEIISKQGSFVTHIMYLKSGYAKVYKETSHNQDMILDIIPAGKLIGLTSLFNNDNIARFSVATLDEATVCSISRNAIEKLVHENSLFAASIIESLNKESLLFYDKMASLAQKQMNGRIADALLYLSENIFHSTEFRMILSRQEMADYTGMSMMSVVRTLQDLKKEGIIADEKGIIKIKAMEALRQISLIG